MANPDDTGQADIPADTDGQSFVRVDGKYLTQALKACGGMVDFKLSSPVLPMLFTTDGYQLVVMPMLTDKSKDEQKRDYEAKAKAEPPAEPVAEQAKPEVTEPKGKRSRAKQPVTA